jgi:predicted nucleic acid-binding protein
VVAPPGWRVEFEPVLTDLRANPNVTIIPFTEELFQAGIDLFNSRSDKEWSLTDCISFVVMEREGLTEVLTADHHFEQAGFIALLK